MIDGIERDGSIFLDLNVIEKEEEEEEEVEVEEQRLRRNKSTNSSSSSSLVASSPYNALCLICGKPQHAQGMGACTSHAVLCHCKQGRGLVDVYIYICMYVCVYSI